jgi:hypothetical protein
MNRLQSKVVLILSLIFGLALAIPSNPLPIRILFAALAAYWCAEAFWYTFLSDEKSDESDES